MRSLKALLVLTVLLSGCSLPVEATASAAESIEPTFLIEETLAAPNEGRQAVLLSHGSEGLHDIYSVFATPVFAGMQEPASGEEYTPPYFKEIYRTIQPWNGEDDVFETLSDRLNGTIEGVSPGNILVPYLLTEEAVNLTDEELLETLSAITETYIFSKQTGSIHYRLIALNEEPDREYSHWMSWHYFVQTWDDDYIWAQPLYEGIEYKFDQAAFVTTPDANQVILLSGYTERPSGSSSAVAGTGFVFEEGIWAPIKWEEMYDKVVELENLEIASDGIRMVYIDPYMAEAFYLPSHTGALYKLKLTEDGSFWADYSMYPQYPANEDLPSEELLFKITQ